MVAAIFADPQRALAIVTAVTTQLSAIAPYAALVGK